MKVLKWLGIVLVLLVLVVGVGAAALVYLVDWNDFKDTIQNQTKKHTGRDLLITGDLSPSVFPWVGISIGDIELANAEEFGDTAFAKMQAADVKVELMPLLRKVVNVRTVELQGLSLNLQRSADGTTNWDDLINSSGEASTTESGADGTEVEVEGGNAAIAALAVGGISVTDASVSWLDEQSGTDAKLNNFNLQTGAIELAKPFDLKTDFQLASNSMGLAADVAGGGSVMIDLDSQAYSLTGFELNTKAVGEALPDGKLDVVLGADINAQLEQQVVSIKNISLDALGLVLGGDVDITQLDAEPNVLGQLASNDFSPLDLFATLGLEAPATADPEVLKSASLSLSLAATPASAALNDLTIKLDDTTFNGQASVPTFEGAIPPFRFDFGVDAIDLDRYLPTPTDTDADVVTEVNTSAAGPAATGDEPLGLPLELMRDLDVEGVFTVGSVKVSNLTTRDIALPLTAKQGVIDVTGLKASLYEGQFNSNARIDASSDTPAFSVDMNLDGIQADPLLADLTQKESFLTGKGQFAANITTSGDSVNALTSALNGGFNTAFNDGSINGVNLGYQIRRAKAALSGQQLSEDEKQVKTDFSELSVSGQIANGVVSSSDLDMRSPLLRVNGDGQLDLPGEQVDYTVTTLITGNAQGQGGEDLEALKGVKLDIPIRGSFAELSANFAGVILQGLKDNITNNLKNQAEAQAREAADKLKREAEAQLKAKEAEARALLEEKEAQAREQLEQKEAEARAAIEAEKARAQEKLEEAAKDGANKLKGKLRGLLGN